MTLADFGTDLTGLRTIVFLGVLMTCWAPDDPGILLALTLLGPFVSATMDSWPAAASLAVERIDFIPLASAPPLPTSPRSLATARMVSATAPILSIIDSVLVLTNGS